MGRQHRGLDLVPDWLQAIHVLFGAVSVIAVGAGAFAALQRRMVIGGLYAGVIGALCANAFVAGALSGVYDRYQSRFMWLAPFALMLMVMTRWQRGIKD